MLFTSPIWLIGLLPWAAVALLLLLSRRPRTDVPFLDLWRLNAPQESIRRSFSTPPLGVVLALLAVLFALIAAAGPAARRPGPHALTVILDAGSSMSALSASAGNETRLSEAVDGLVAMLRDEESADRPIELLVVPSPPGRANDPQRMSAEALLATARALPPSALNTRDLLHRVARERLANADSQLLVVTDQAISIQSGRVARITPLALPAENAGISHLAVRRTPTPQAMVRVERAGSSAAPQPLSLRITTAGEFMDHPLAVVSGQTQTLFVALPRVGSVVTAELLDANGNAAADAFAGDNRIYVVAESDWPLIRPEIAVGDLQRLIDIYSLNRPPGEQSVTLRLTSSVGLLGGSPGIVLPGMTSDIVTTQVLRAVDHPILTSLDLASLPLPASTDRTMPPGTWQPLLFDEAGPLLAVRELVEPSSDNVVRQAWCAIAPHGWAYRVQYVIFWSSLFDWLGRTADAGVDGEAGAVHMAYWPLERLTAEWTPIERAPGGDGAFHWAGLYQRQGDARRRAFGPAVPATGAAPVPAAEQRDQLRRLLRQGERQVSAAPWLLLIALGLAGCAAALWRRSARHLSIVGVKPGVGTLVTVQLPVAGPRRGLRSDLN